MVFDDSQSNIVFPNHFFSHAQRVGLCKTIKTVAVAGLLFLTTNLAGEESTTASLTASLNAGDLTRVHAVIEMDGQLKLNPDGKKVTNLPLKGTGELVYEERLVAPASGEQASIHVRHYEKAEAKFAVGEGAMKAALSSDRRVVGVKTTDSQSTLFSPLGPLTKDELDLIDIQGSSAILHRLLPDKEVSIGEKWSPSNETAATLLRLDVVTENKLESTLKKIDGTTAYCELAGTISGSSGGISSDITVTAKFNFDTSKKQVNWLAMGLHEVRAIGHAEPGFDVKARIRVEVTPRSESKELAPEVVSTLPLTGEDSSTYLVHTGSEQTFRMLLPRSWKIMVDRHDVTILRFVDRGEMIAQCNLSKLPDAAADKQLAMESFQVDIQRSLAKNFSQFVEAKTFKTNRGLRAMRVVAAGMVAELPIQWIYYHLTDKDGRQATIVFTLDANLVERFGGEDQTFINSFELLPEPAKPEATASRSAKTEKK